MKLLLDKSETAASLSISESTLSRMVAEGTIVAPIKLGGRVLWRRKDIEHFVDSLAENDPVKLLKPAKKRGRPRLSL